MKKVQNKALLDDKDEPTTNTATSLTRSMIPSSKQHMRKIHFMKLLLRNAVVRKKQSLRMLPKRRGFTGISYNYKLHRVRSKAGNKCFYSYLQSAERKPDIIFN